MPTSCTKAVEIESKIIRVVENRMYPVGKRSTRSWDSHGILPLQRPQSVGIFGILLQNAQELAILTMLRPLDLHTVDGKRAIVHRLQIDSNRPNSVG